MIGCTLRRVFFFFLMPARIRVWFFNIYLRRYCPKVLFWHLQRPLFSCLQNLPLHRLQMFRRISFCIFRFIQTFNQVFRKHFQVFSGTRKDSVTVRAGVIGKFQLFLRAGHSHEEQTSFFVLLIKTGSTQRQQTIIHTDDENTGKFQSF